MEWVLGAVIVVLLCVVAGLLWRQRRTQQLREGFGPEYDRVVHERGDQRKAEAELLERRQRREHLSIRPLDPAARERYTESWHAAQRRFVEEPEAAVVEADELVMAVMRDRGYPVEDFEQRAADVSVDHPDVVENYRAARAISLASSENRAQTEDLRQAMVHFRALFAELLGDREDRPADDRARDDVKEAR
jgi:hypothetical protein